MNQNTERACDTETRQKLPSGWRWGTLGEALKHRKESITIDDSQVYKRVTVKLHGRGIELRDTVPGSAITTKKQQLAKTDDFLVAEIDAKMGGFGIVPAQLQGAIVSSHYFLFEIEQSLVLPGYLELFIKTNYITQEILTFVRGSLNYAAIRPRHVLALPFPFARISVQRKIINALEAIDAARQALGREMTLVEALPGALLSSALKGNIHIESAVDQFSIAGR